LGLSTFPSLLLLTTLFRLSLNIASTKLILLNGAAGHIIDTFGRLVVGGNVVVGLVVFLIIAIVQFIVIAKGAERVAEVGARFSLDGMPGKQMSIDADLRGGLIDKEEAQRRRSGLEEESRLYGAMDGAMKFVKGDAIAGMLIANGWASSVTDASPVTKRDKIARRVGSARAENVALNASLVGGI